MRQSFALKKKGSMCPLYPMGEGICEDLTSIKEGNLSSLLFLLQGQAWLTACSIRKISFFLLGPRPRWVQRGRKGKNGPFLQHHPPVE